MRPFGATALIRALPFHARLALYRQARASATEMGQPRHVLAMRFWRAFHMGRLLKREVEAAR